MNNKSFKIGATYTGTVYSVKRDRVHFYIKIDGDVKKDKIQATYHIKGGNTNPYLDYKKGSSVDVKLIGIYDEKRRKELLVEPLATKTDIFIMKNPVGSVVTGVIKKIKCKGDYQKNLIIEVAENVFVSAVFCSHAQYNASVECKITGINANHQIHGKVTIKQ